ncbi:MAG: hypothetical protein JWO19_5727 [Bryobacterales bacterium]|jgi:hypothetical protein|nr:hypothetical protein [Bryobacterales bacterium]
MIALAFVAGGSIGMFVGLLVGMYVLDSIQDSDS